jgi:hypothetical protein
MSAINTGILRAARDRGFLATSWLMDDLSSSASATQSGAVALNGTFHRVTAGASGTSYIMKSMLSKEAPYIVIVVNDGPNSINVYPAVGETMNGSANAAQAVAAGATGIFVSTSVSDVKDWRANVIT